MIKAVFFDLYNTLLHYEPFREEIEAQALKEFGFEKHTDDFRYPFLKADEYFFGENARSRVNDRPEDEKRAVYLRYQQIVLGEAGIPAEPRIVQAVVRRWSQTKFDQVLFEDVLPTLKDLKGNYLLGLISNIDSDIEPMLRKLGLLPLLEIIVTSLETGYTKPHPAIFNAAIERAGVAADEVLYIGDQYQIDVIGAAETGMKAVLLDRYDNFEREMKYPRITSLTQLREHL